MAARAIRFCHIESEINVADVLTKPLPNPVFHSLIRPFLFRLPNGERWPRKIEPEVEKGETSGAKGARESLVHLVGVRVVE